MNGSVCGLMAILVGIVGRCALAAPSLARETIPPDMPGEVRPLVEQLYSSEPRQCIAATMALGRLGPTAVTAAPYLASTLDGHFSEEIPNQSAIALVRIGQGAFDAVAAATSATGGDARRRSVLAMAQIDPVRAAPVIMELIAGDMAGDYTIGALRATGQVGLDLALAWARSPEAVRRRAAARAVLAYLPARLGYHDVHGMPGANRPARAATQQNLDLLLGLLADNEPAVRRAAMASLERVPSRELTIPLNQAIQAALRDERPALRVGAIDLVRVTSATEKDKFDAIEPLVSDSSPEVRSAAAAALVGMPEQRGRAVTLMRTLLNNASDDTRAQAALALGRLRDGGAERSLRDALNDSSIRVRVSAAIALARCSGPEGIQAVMELTRSQDPQLRFESSRALAERCLDQAGVAWSNRLCFRMTGSESLWPPRIGLVPVPAALRDSFPDKAVRDRLLELLHGSDKDLHAPAAEALITGAGTAKVPQSVLLAALASPVRSPRYVALLHMEQSRDVPDPAFLEPLRRVAQTGDLQGDCLSLLLRMGDTATVLRAGERLAKHSYSKAACQRLGILATAGEPAFDMLFKYAADPRPDVRETAARILGARIDHPRILAFVETAAKSEEANVRQGALLVLKYADRRAAPPLALRMQLRDAMVTRDQGWRNLYRQVDATAAQLAKDLLRDNDVAVRAAAAEMLGESKDDSAVAALTEALADRSPLVRSQVAVLLARLGRRSGAASILRLLADPEPAVREAAASALGRVGDAAAIEPLTASLADANWRLRMLAAQSLGLLRDVRSAQPLRKALASDPCWQVRAAAATALGRLGDPSVPALIAAIGDEHWHVRQTSAEALESLTRQKLGPDAQAWEAWWKARPAATTGPTGR